MLLAWCLSVQAQSGFVRSTGQPIPGATITITQGEKSLSTVTDADGHYTFPPLGVGSWKVQVEMFGFQPLQQEADYTQNGGRFDFALQLKESEAAQRIRAFSQRMANGAQQGSGSGARSPQAQTDAELQGLLNNGGTQSFSAPAAGSGQAGGSNESFLVSGSLSPGMAAGRPPDSGPEMMAFGGVGTGDITGQSGNPAAFAQSGGAVPGGAGGFGGGPGGFGGGGFGGGPRGGGGRFGGPGAGRRPGAGPPPGAVFGNRRRRTQTIHGEASFSLQNSALNAKPFSLNGLDVPQASYAQSRFSLIMGGPLVLKKVVHDPSTQFFITYFGTRAKTPELFTETVPTDAERRGDFSRTVQSLGSSGTAVPVLIFDPATRLPFPGNTIPTTMLNPISLGLLNFYPRQNQVGLSNNYQFETAQASNTDNLGLRIQRSITKKDRLSFNFQLQDRDGTTAQPFGYSDSTNGYGINTQLQWTRNLGAATISNAQIRFNRNVTRLNPYFATQPDVATELGIGGTSGDPINNGPPTLTFTNYASLSDGTYSVTRNQSQTGGESITLLRGSHSVTLGFTYTRADLARLTDPNGRGTLSFTGVATSQVDAGGNTATQTGYDLADFLLGYQQSSSIRYGATSNYFYENQYAAYVQDEWKILPNLTLTGGLRYEYFSPFAEKYGRMANLDIAPGFSAVTVVLPNQPGVYSGTYSNALIDPDHNNFAPRLALAWKLPWDTKHSTLLRAGYGIYYNQQAYIQLAQQLAQQPPFAISNAVNTSTENVLTLQRGFLDTTPQSVTNTFAVSRGYRTPYAGTWNLTLEHDFSGGFFVEVGYLGTKGTRLDVRTTPNQTAPGSSQIINEATQVANASGFLFDDSIGNSIFHALQVRAVRRFSRSLSFNVFYQFAKSIDDSSTFGGAGNTSAQNWLDISAERGLSSFDVRHQLQGTFVLSSPYGAPFSTLPDDTKVGKLLKSWQLTGSVTAQTGNPLTARVLGSGTQLAQTGGTGSNRADSTGEPIILDDGFFNLGAFSVPASGTFGNAGRNTIPGPDLVSVNLAVSRSFNLSERRRLEFRFEANNVLNHVNYTSFYTVVNAVNYGLPSTAGAMRTLNAVVRFRF
jgi:trimeric autotransporter adhesin